MDEFYLGTYSDEKAEALTITGKYHFDDDITVDVFNGSDRKSCNSKSWLRGKIPFRINKPVSIYQDGSFYFMKDGKDHREDGVSSYDAEIDYFCYEMHDVEYYKQEYFLLIL